MKKILQFFAAFFVLIGSTAAQNNEPYRYKADDKADRQAYRLHKKIDLNRPAQLAKETPINTEKPNKTDLLRYKMDNKVDRQHARWARRTFKN